MRKNLGAKPLSYPQPVFIIAAYGADGVPSAMNAAWAGITNHTEITMCLDRRHKTVEDLRSRGAFTVSMGTAPQVVACDYVGIVSGHKVPDKFARASTPLPPSLSMPLSSTNCRWPWSAASSPTMRNANCSQAKS